MTFFQSRAISKAGLHVRRSAWSADKWLMIWRGTWFCFASGNPPHPVRATDYSAADLLATDWTTMPAALAACPIDPTIGSTGGASATPGTDGFPDDPTPPILSISGSGAPSGPDDPTVLPPPDPGSGYTITFAGVQQKTLSWFHAGDLNGTYPLYSVGTGAYQATFPNGRSDFPKDAIWTITMNRFRASDSDPWSFTGVVMSSSELDDSGTALQAFATPGTSDGIVLLGQPIPNAWADAMSSPIYGYAGTATVN